MPFLEIMRNFTCFTCGMSHQWVEYFLLSKYHFFQNIQSDCKFWATLTKVKFSKFEIKEKLNNKDAE